MSEKNPNGCKWISLNKTTNCGKQLAKANCESEMYCSYHNYLIRKGGENHVCSECGVGVKSKHNFCVKHGLKFKNERMKSYNDKHSIIRQEFNRLKKINL